MAATGDEPFPETRPDSDPGDEVLRRFRYQHAFGVILLVGALRNELPYVALWCEHYEDLMGERDDGLFDAYQVKTRDTGEWTLADDNLRHSIKRFVALDAALPGKIAKFVFASNRLPQNSHAKDKIQRSPFRLLEAVKKADSVSELAEPYASAFERLQAKCACDGPALLAVLKKLHFPPGPDYIDIDAIVAHDHVSRLYGDAAYTREMVSALTGNLIRRVADASALVVNDPRKHWWDVTDDDPDSPNLRAKRISVEDIGCVVGDAIARARSSTLAHDQSAPADRGHAIVDAYHTWLQRDVVSFFIPGLDAPLDTKTMWMRQTYLDPKDDDGDPASPSARRRAERRRSQALQDDDGNDRSFDADHLMDYAPLAVIIAGPGSGKSTLVRRTALRLRLLGRSVVRVRLQQVAGAYIENDGVAFDDALARAVRETSSIGQDDAHYLLRAPDYLLADGLDECDPHREVIAAALRTWALARSETRVMVTTRPVGYVPGPLAIWEHVTLNPPSSIEVYRFVQQVAKLGGADAVVIENRVRAYRRRLERHGRLKGDDNPLLIALLTILAMDDRDPGPTRASLFNRIIEHLYEKPSADRRARPKPPSVEARYVLQSLGWHRHREPHLRYENLTQRIGRELACELDMKPLQASGRAEDSVAFWEHQGIIESMGSGLGREIVFGVPILGEYAAGCYAAGLDDAKLRAWLHDVRREPAWREIIVLAAGAGAAQSIATMLLDLNRPNDPVAIEIPLAAEVLAEPGDAATDEPSPTLAQTVARGLADRMRSHIPFVAYEAGEAAMRLAASYPNAIAPLVQPLIQHEQVWTHLAALRAALACAGRRIDAETVMRAVDTIITTTGGRRRGALFDSGEHWPLDRTSEFEQELVIEGLVYLLDRWSGPATKSFVSRLMTSGLISAYMHLKLVPILQAREEVADIAVEAERKASEIFDAEEARHREQQRRREADNAVLEAVRRLVGNVGIVPAEGDTPVLTSLGALCHGMDWFAYPTAAAWDVLGLRPDTDASDAVFRGAIAALGIDKERLAVEAAWAANHLDQFYREDRWLFGLLFEVPRVLTRPNWSAAVAAALPAALLVRALSHPSVGVATYAAGLLAHGVSDARTADLVKHTLMTSNREEVISLVADIAPPLWGNKAVDIVLERLTASLTSLSCPLLETLPDLAGATDNAEVTARLVHGLDQEDPLVVVAAARGLAKLPGALLRPLIPTLRRVLQHWRNHGTSAPTHPAPVIAALLEALGDVDDDELMVLCNGPIHDLRVFAAHTLANRGRHNMETLFDLIERIGNGQLPILVLDEILALPVDTLAPVGDALLSLRHARATSLRVRAAGMLTTATWLDSETRLALARVMLNDDETSVRDQALVTARALDRLV